MKLPTDPKRGDDIAHKVREIIRYLRSSRVTSVVGGTIRETANGSVITVKPGRGGASGTTASTCPFGELETSTDDPPVTSIRGGLMTCGDQNFNVANYVLDLETDGEWLVQIALTGVTCATDDAEEIFLPGVTTATGTPSWEVITYTGSENYDDTTNPTAPDSPTGTAIVGIGRIKILDGAATFSPTGCGTIRVGQCAGIISHSRG